MGVSAEGYAAFTASRYIAQGETNVGFGHGEAFDDIADGLSLGAVGPHEFQAGGGGVEQVAKLYHCACG